MADLVLREATDADVPTVVRLIHAAFEEYRGTLDPPSGAHQETEDSVRRKMSSAAVVMAFAAGVPSGCLFYERAADHLSFSRLAVPPSHRGRGIGRALIAYVEQQEQALNRRCVRLGVRIALTRLRAYYERLGYRVVEHGAHDGYGEPTYVILAKSIPARNDREAE